jgi:hypothetical protein
MWASRSVRATLTERPNRTVGSVPALISRRTKTTDTLRSLATLAEGEQLGRVATLPGTVPAPVADIGSVPDRPDVRYGPGGQALGDHGLGPSFDA